MSDTLRTTSGSPFEEQFGFTRAIRVGNIIKVAGTGPIEDDGTTTPGGASEQAERCCALIVNAIEQLGGSASDVVRTRMLLTEPTDQDAVGAGPRPLFRRCATRRNNARRCVALPTRMESRNRGRSNRSGLAFPPLFSLHSKG